MARTEARVASADDRDAVIALWKACGLTRAWNDPVRDFDTARASNASDVFVIEADNVIIASVMVGHDGHRGAVYYLAVAPSHQRQGVGRALMQHAEDWCVARGMWKLNLMVRDDNQDALGFYAALGYAHGHTTQLARWIDPEQPEPKRP
ncbi:MAG: GNAT family acetyltransferase [Pseudomonadota bacterium]